MGGGTSTSSIRPVNNGIAITNLNPKLIKDKWLRETRQLLILDDRSELQISLAKPDPKTTRVTNAFCPMLLTFAFKDKNGNFVFDEKRDLPLHCWINQPRSVTLSNLLNDMGLRGNVATILADYSGAIKSKPTTDETVDYVIQGLKRDLLDEDISPADEMLEIQNSWPPKS